MRVSPFVASSLKASSFQSACSFSSCIRSRLAAMSAYLPQHFVNPASASSSTLACRRCLPSRHPLRLHTPSYCWEAMQTYFRTMAIERNGASGSTICSSGQDVWHLWLVARMTCAVCAAQMKESWGMPASRQEPCTAGQSGGAR